MPGGTRQTGPNLPELPLYWLARPQGSGTHRDTAGTWQSTETVPLILLHFQALPHRGRAKLRLYLASSLWASPRAVWQASLPLCLLQLHLLFPKWSLVCFFSSNLSGARYLWGSLLGIKILNALCAQEALWCNGRRPGFLLVPTLLCVN